MQSWRSWIGCSCALYLCSKIGKSEARHSSGNGREAEVLNVRTLSRWDDTDMQIIRPKHFWWHKPSPQEACQKNISCSCNTGCKTLCCSCMKEKLIIFCTRLCALQQHHPDGIKYLNEPLIYIALAATPNLMHLLLEYFTSCRPDVYKW